ncbi:ABC transporter ATP-binding protein [archaeon]|nr:ABC transporter ATP-binding protein [archaeon]
MENPVVEISNLNFSYHGQAVLRDVSLNIRPADFVAMIGPNGGKTTLLKLMLGLLTPGSGRIRVFGRPPKDISHRIGYVPQNVHINNNFPISALDVVLMGKLKPGRLRTRHSDEDRKTALQTLARLGMEKFHNQRIGELSGGQKQRVFVARALVTDPDLLLLDEPTAGIDAKGQNEFYALLEELNAEVTIIVVSHDLMVISRYVKSVACVNQRLHYHGQPELTDEMVEMMYSCTVDETCPVELIAHGLPHRVLKQHDNS